MPSRQPLPSFKVNAIRANSLAIQQEIQRFESVHPSIYAIYDLVELIPDSMLAQDIREHVVTIEDSFVNSQEWTLSRKVPDLRLGIVGSVSSGKSALVHRYLTGSFMQEESPEGGRFKKEMTVDGQSYQLLIRDEGDPPEAQFSSWTDAVIFVFSFEDESSFTDICKYYTDIVKFRDIQEIPVILVGTRDAIGRGKSWEISDARVKKLVSDLKNCTYYETCAASGHNVERVFDEACLKICQSQARSRPMTPINFSSEHLTTSTREREHGDLVSLSSSLLFLEDHSSTSPVKKSPKHKGSEERPKSRNEVTPFDTEVISSPSSTPTPVRKSKRRSSLFTPTSKKNNGDEKRCEELGVGRCIPIKKGHLNKKSSKSFSKTLSKKYVTLCDDGKMSYHSSLQEYMENVHGKEIPLPFVTVKVPGQGPRGQRKAITMNKDSHVSSKIGSSSLDVLQASGTRDMDRHTLGDSNIAKKKQRRTKSQDYDDPEGFEFVIISLENKQWQFEAQTARERDEWVKAIQDQIMIGLQGNKSSKTKERNCGWEAEQEAMDRIKHYVEGNNECVDCGKPQPTWASLNLGVLMCIECSGVHRNLGSHVSRVRSLDLDSWTQGHLAVLLNIGNYKANQIWEAKLGQDTLKPDYSSTRNDKEKYIKAKYERKEFLMDLPMGPTAAQTLIDSICKSDLPGVGLALSHAKEGEVNFTVSSWDGRTPLHLASALGNLGIVQMLIWAGSNVGQEDHEGRMSVGHARDSGAEDVVQLLMNAGNPG